MQKQIAKLPKTFVVFSEDCAGNRGYIRYTSYMTDNGTVDYGMTLVKKISDASRYVTLDNAKAKAKAIKDGHGFVSVEVVDETTRKTYTIR